MKSAHTNQAAGKCGICGGKIINKTNSIDHMESIQSDNLYVDNWSVK